MNGLWRHLSEHPVSTPLYALAAVAGTYALRNMGRSQSVPWGTAALSLLVKAREAYRLEKETPLYR